MENAIAGSASGALIEQNGRLRPGRWPGSPGRPLRQQPRHWLHAIAMQWDYSMVADFAPLRERGGAHCARDRISRRAPLEDELAIVLARSQVLRRFGHHHRRDQRALRPRLDPAERRSRGPDHRLAAVALGPGCAPRGRLLQLLAAPLEPRAERPARRVPMAHDVAHHLPQQVYVLMHVAGHPINISSCVAS
jgi:hypothetical protein